MVTMTKVKIQQSRSIIHCSLRWLNTTKVIVFKFLFIYASKRGYVRLLIIQVQCFAYKSHEFSYLIVIKKQKMKSVL